MKYSLPVHEFSFNKIKTGQRKVGVHLLDKQAQQIKINDVLELKNGTTGELLERQVSGIAVFDNFSDLVDALSPQSLGYNSKEEIMLRLRRIYSPNAQQSLNAVGFFLKPLPEKNSVKTRSPIER